jgi:hypothetical protein
MVIPIFGFTSANIVQRVEDAKFCPLKQVFRKYPSFPSLLEIKCMKSVGLTVKDRVMFHYASFAWITASKTHVIRLLQVKDAVKDRVLRTKSKE